MNTQFDSLDLIHMTTGSNCSEARKIILADRPLPSVSSLFLLAGAEPSPLVVVPFIGLLYQPWMIEDDDDDDDDGAISGMND
jgi:hypothetical protein